LVEAGGVDEAFIAAHTVGFEACREQALAADWDALEAESGATRADMERFATLLIDKPNAIFVWSMGLTQHERGADTVAAVLNLGLASELFGEHRVMLPIRGHSGVQGGAEVGCIPSPSPAQRERWAAEWGFPLPDHEGMSANEMVEASAR